MSEIEQAYKEGYAEGAWHEKDIDDAWAESTARKTEAELAAQRKIVRECSDKLKAELNR